MPGRTSARGASTSTSSARVRAATLALFRHLPVEAWTRRGVASGQVRHRPRPRLHHGRSRCPPREAPAGAVPDERRARLQSGLAGPGRTEVRPAPVRRRDSTQREPPNDRPPGLPYCVRVPVRQQTSGARIPSNSRMTSFTSDLRFALRGLRCNPVFSTVAILSLALGIGANTAIFTLIDQIVLRKLPVKNPDELVMLYQQGPHNGSNMGSRMHSYPIYQDYQQRAEPLSEVVCRRLVPASVSIDNHTERLEAEMVSGNFFSMLGVPPAARPRLQLPGRRPGLRGASRRRARLRLLDGALRAGSVGGRQEDPRQQLPDDHRRRLGGGLRRASIPSGRRRSGCRSR